MDYEKLWNELKEFIDGKKIEYTQKIFKVLEDDVVNCTIVNTSYTKYDEISNIMKNLEIDEERRKCND